MRFCRASLGYANLTAAVTSQSGLCPQPNVINASIRMWCEFGSKKAAAILGRLPVSRVRIESSLMLHAAHRHSAQAGHALRVAGLAFSNPDIHREAKFAPRLHRASLKATPEFRLSLLPLSIK
jgi:hypothetical protein